jgi:hypothetical protein
MTDELLHCSLRRCIQGKLDHRMPRVEMKSIDLPLEDRDHMLIEWAEDGQAMLHDICWRAVINSFKMDNPFVLCPREKELVQEAKKSCEYFDARDKVLYEADRVARMLKESKYAVAFTGMASNSITCVQNLTFDCSCRRWYFNCSGDL